MDISVVIVNYNVKHFILQCLQSVYNAMGNISTEIFVVDNASSDNSCAAIKERFPQVNLIENSQNVGFSGANNQAIKLTTGKYVLLLNPDTVLQEDTLQKCFNFMEATPDAGALTVKMIDGKGNYLPESKRGFPTPWVSFCKIFGLTALFPHSKKFARYYLGHLNPNETNQIDILPGAFMFIRNEALQKTGLLDEQFFMYGEDIDLSYRLTQNGFKNYYYPECQIIHYKGESTKKGSLNYVIIFYKAMILFARKHFSNKANGFIFLINIAIYFKAFLSILKRFANAIWLPALDILLSATVFILLVPYWQQIRFNSLDYYPKDSVILLVSIYILIWVFTLWLIGAYNKPQKPFAAGKGIALGTVIILAFYSILPYEMRFSRAIILIGSIFTLIATQGVRMIISIFNHNLFNWGYTDKKTVIIANSTEALRVNNLLERIGISHEHIENYEPINLVTADNTINTKKFEAYLKINSINEVIFCPADLPMSNIIKAMLLLSSMDLEFKIAPNDSTTIIGSNSINAQGELYSLEFKTIGTPNNRRYKRLFDMGTAAILIITFIFWLPFCKKRFKLLSSSLAVISGKKTWIGYSQNCDINELPKLRKGVFQCVPLRINPNSNLNDFNLFYAKNYNVIIDMKYLWQNLTNR